MVTEWLFHLASPWRAVRRAAIPLGLIVFFCYLVLNGLYSERGYFNMQKRQVELGAAETELSILRDERMALEQRVDLLKGEAIGRDLLEEEARRVLNLAHRDEVVVRMPPTAETLYGDVGSDTGGDGGISSRTGGSGNRN